MAAFLFAFADARADVLLQWDTFGNNGLETSQSSIFNSSSIMPSNLTLGAGITPTSTSASVNRFGGTAWFDAGDSSPTTLAESISGNDYIEFIVTPIAGASFTPTQFTFSWQVNNVVAGPNSLALRSSADSFGTDLASGSVANTNVNVLTFNITGLTDLSTATTFRLYGYGGTQSATSGGFDTSSTDPGYNVQLSGTVSAIPEPSTYATIFGATALIGTVLARRRSARLASRR